MSSVGSCRQGRGLGVVLQQDPGPEGPTTTGGGCRNGDSRPVAHGAGGPQRPGRADQAGVRSGFALLFEVRLDDAHRLNRTPPDRGDREDSASLRTVGRALGSCPDVDTRRGGGLRPESRPNGGERWRRACGGPSARRPTAPAKAGAPSDSKRCDPLSGPAGGCGRLSGLGGGRQPTPKGRPSARWGQFYLLNPLWFMNSQMRPIQV